jgi:hypothetical protein
MDNFNLRKYLAEGRLLKEETMSFKVDPDVVIKDYLRDIETKKSFDKTGKPISPPDVTDLELIGYDKNPPQQFLTDEKEEYVMYYFYNKKSKRVIAITYVEKPTGSDQYKYMAQFTTDLDTFNRKLSHTKIK